MTRPRMPRRLALPLAFLLTGLVGFLIIRTGAMSSLFADSPEVAAAMPVATPATEQALAPTPEPTADLPVPDPIIHTTYVYEDEYYTVYVGSGEPEPTPTSAPPATPVIQAPPQAPVSQPTPPTRVSQPQPTPTQPKPTPPAPSPTPSQPPPTPAATAPPSPPENQDDPPNGGQQDEIEFESTVTSIDGDMVTFANGTTVKVTSGLSKLQVGTRVHVHARLQNGVYVANELEVEH